MRLPLDLQDDIPDRALPDALRALLVQRTEALEGLLYYAKDTMDTMPAHGSILAQEQTTRVDGLAKEVSQRLIVLEDQHRQIQTHLEEFQRLLRQQGNPILAHTVERVKEVLEQNLAVARQHLSAIIHRQSP
jgi:hypothetical protein